MKISVVIPSYNEEQNISLLFEKLQKMFSALSYNLIFVDDGSRDRTFEEVKKLSSKYSNVCGISLSRNFGHQVALYAGLQEAKGDVIIMMDADGQHPPEVIPKLLEEFNKGFDIVNTRRLSTQDAGQFKNISSKLFYRLINSLTELKIEPASSDFRLMSRKAVDAFLKIEEKDRFTRGLVSWMGFRQNIIEYEAPERMTGKSKYTLKRMVRFAIDGITSFSARPLKISFMAGIITLLIAFIYSVYVIVVAIMGETVKGWTSLMLVILFIGGVQLLSIGIIGEYLSRIFNESKNRPLYFINDRC